MKCILNWVVVVVVFFLPNSSCKANQLGKTFFLFSSGFKCYSLWFYPPKLWNLVKLEQLLEKRKHETLNKHLNCLICFCISLAFSCWHCWGRDVRNECWWLLRPSVNSSCRYLFTIPPLQTVSRPLKVILKTLWTHCGLGFFTAGISRWMSSRTEAMCVALDNFRLSGILTVWMLWKSSNRRTIEVPS